MLQNPNGLSPSLVNNEKLERQKEVCRSYQIDVLGSPEIRCNWTHRDVRLTYASLFQSEIGSSAISAHNSNENVSAIQEGGVGLTIFGDLSGFVVGRGRDSSNLGRWTWFDLSGQCGVVTRIITAYQPCYSAPTRTRTTYNQQRRHFRESGDFMCPRVKFRSDLIQQLISWRQDGKRLILMMDANDHVYQSTLARDLRLLADMKEAVLTATGSESPATFFRGSQPIDGIWCTQDIDVLSAAVMPIGVGVGDHRAIILDISTTSLLGSTPTKVVRPQARRLQTWVPRVLSKYNSRLMELMHTHNCFNRLHKLQIQYLDTGPTPELDSALDKLDQETGDYMRAAEKKCRKIQVGLVPFSPETSMWLRRRQVYKSLLRNFDGKIRNKANLRRSARRCGIRHPFHLSRSEVLELLTESIVQCRQYVTSGKTLRRRHLRKRLTAAESRGDEEAIPRIEEILRKERSKNQWRNIRLATAAPRGRSVMSVQVEDGDEIVEYTTQAAVHEAIMKECSQRFTLAQHAPVCNGELFRQLGFTAVTPAADAILAGTYVPPPHTDSATCDILSEISSIAGVVPRNAFSATIDSHTFQQYWKRARESTSSSHSGRHFGHYKAASYNSKLSLFHSIRISLANNLGRYHSRWKRGLSVMLEKKFGVTLVNKLRAILLMEADFNFSNKEIFGVRMLETARRYGLFPDEVYSEKNRTAETGSLTKVLFYDVVRQSRRPAAIGSYDAANCYDSVAHGVASLVFQAFGTPASCCKTLLTAIQDMEYYLRTGHGDSESFFGGSILVRTHDTKSQGLVQGNGAAPAGWGVISVVILNAQKTRGFGARFLCPITKKGHHAAAIMYVDDTDVLQFRMDVDESVDEVFDTMQRSTTNWARLLHATGGSLKPEKCFYHLISFDWKDGRWSYANNCTEAFHISIPLQDGSTAPITQLPVDVPQITLGVATCPTGSCTGYFEQLHDKTDRWIAKISSSNLSRAEIWRSMQRQWWPSVRYGLGTTLGSSDDLDKCLHSRYFKMLPLLGVMRTIKCDWRTLTSGFFGVGLPDLSIHSLICQANHLLQHFGNSDSTGHLLAISYALFFLEVGISFQPLQSSFSSFGSLATPSWFSSLWEKASRFHLSVSIKPPITEFPRENDEFIMVLLSNAGYSGDRLLRLNRVRVSLQLLFLSDILCADGRTLNRQVLHPRPKGVNWSDYNWPEERPTPSDFALWRAALSDIAPMRRSLRTVFRWRRSTHCRLFWSFDAESDTLWKRGDEEWFCYQHSDANGLPNRYVLCEEHTAPPPGTVLATTAPLRHGCHRLLYSSSHPIPPMLPPTCLAEYLRRELPSWMWDNLSFTGSLDWIATAIKVGSLLAVTDGSYFGNLCPTTCSAAFILECERSSNRLVGTVVESSHSAGSYRGELLGLLALHLLLASATKFYDVTDGDVRLYCDSLGGLRRVSHLPPYQIPVRYRHSDILRILHQQCRHLPFGLDYRHIRAHQDDSTAWEHLSRPAQLNCKCDYRAKYALRSALLRNTHASPVQNLPHEVVTISANTVKVIGDAAPVLEFHCNLQKARNFYNSWHILSFRQFDQVDWVHINETMNALPVLYRLWASKLVSKFFGSMQQRHRTDSLLPQCPSCQSCVETSFHIPKCPEVGRTNLFKTSVHTLIQWMKTIDCDDRFRELVSRYILGRGQIQFSTLVDGYPRFHALAISQDEIGWERFMQGMISKQWYLLFAEHCSVSHLHLSPRKCIRSFIQQILQISHSQWTYRNLLVHHRTAGYLAECHRQDNYDEIEAYLHSDPDAILAEDRPLLDITHEELLQLPPDDCEYWLLAIRNARHAFVLSQPMHQQDRTRRADAPP